jgi:hypothetical protein
MLAMAAIKGIKLTKRMLAIVDPPLLIYFLSSYSVNEE